MLVDSTRLKCKREWKQIITYPLQKFFHGCIVISHLLTFEIKNMFCNNLFKFQCHPSHRIIIQQQGGVHHGNKWLHQELLWRPLSKDQRRRRRRYALFGILSTSVTMDPAMDPWYPAWQWYALRTMWWVPSYAQIHWSTVGRPTSQRDFVDSNKTSRVIRYSWPLKPHDVAGYDHRAACPFLMLIVIILLIITLTSVQAILVEF